MLLLGTTSEGKQSRQVNHLKALGAGGGYVGSWRERDMTNADSERGGGGIPDTVSLATEIPSFYLSAGLRPVGTGRRAATGRRHSRTLASSRTSRAEAERSLPPAGRRLTGRRRMPSAGVLDECRHMVVLFCVAGRSCYVGGLLSPWMLISLSFTPTVPSSEMVSWQNK